jgi:hypothetical protein
VSHYAPVADYTFTSRNLIAQSRQGFRVPLAQSCNHLACRHVLPNCASTASNHIASKLTLKGKLY